MDFHRRQFRRERPARHSNLTLQMEVGLSFCIYKNVLSLYFFILFLFYIANIFILFVYTSSKFGQIFDQSLFESNRLNLITDLLIPSIFSKIC